MSQQHFLIVGGGTAGWMAANLLINAWGDKHKVTLVESPDIGIIGVGEGSTPQLKAFFDKIGVTEQEWMPACNATYKNGISFVGWSEKPGFERYFHPFPSHLDVHTAKAFVYNCYARRQGLDVPVNPDSFFLPAALAEQQLGPQAAENFPFAVSYGYHFDSHLLGQFLAKVAVRRGVEHIQAKVSDVRLHPSGDIAGIVLDDGRAIDAEMFIDSTGFRSLLLQQTLGVPFESFASNLFNNAAVVMPTPQGEVPNSQTISTAMQYGWAWDIPLVNRVGNGYVYSDNYCSADAAETELRAKLGLLESNVEARHLKMRVGQVSQHWQRNCLAVGLSQGFIEPLEATALHIVQDTIESFIQAYESGDWTHKHQSRFNAKIRARFEGIRDYIVCHYRANSRTDTDYWRDNASNEHLSESLRQILHAWLQGADLSAEIQRQDISKYYSSQSWHCLLAGYGVFPSEEQLRPPKSGEAPHKISEISEFIRRCTLNFSSHDKALAALQPSI